MPSRSSEPSTSESDYRAGRDAWRRSGLLAGVQGIVDQFLRHHAGPLLDGKEQGREMMLALAGQYQNTWFNTARNGRRLY